MKVRRAPYNAYRAMRNPRTPGLLWLQDEICLSVAQALAEPRQPYTVVCLDFVHGLVFEGVVHV